MVRIPFQSLIDDTVKNILILKNITLMKTILKETFNTKGLTIIVSNTLYNRSSRYLRIHEFVRSS